MTHEEKVQQWIGVGKMGTEIGPGSAPVPGFDPRPIFVDCFKSFGTAPNFADYYGHACALPFHDHSLDYVVASHVLEHVANPIAALAEWYRVVRPGGILYLVVPDRRATWEHRRPLTPVAHFFEDYARGTTACDATHIDEFVYEADWSRYSPETPPDEVPAKQAELARGMHEAVQRGEDINIHFHTFETASVRELIETLMRPPVDPASEGVDQGSAATSGRGLARMRTTPGPEVPAPPGTRFSNVPFPVAPRFHWEIVDFEEGFPRCNPNGVLAIVRVHKGWRARGEADALRIRTRGNPQAVLRPDAEPFAAWAARTAGLGGVR
jgi:SAM-dependent methyltransferase